MSDVVGNEKPSEWARFRAREREKRKAGEKAWRIRHVDNGE